jgi:hypothetical protein
MNLKKLAIALIFIVMIIAWISSAVITVVPDSSASKVCHLGYKAHCSFTPSALSSQLLRQQSPS